MIDTRMRVSHLISVLENKQRMSHEDDPKVGVKGDKLVVDGIDSDEFDYVVVGTKED